MNQAQVTPDQVKDTLKTYSKFLRRDFLAILVKMSAKALQIRTVRSDWRTRKGMILFLQNVWPKFTGLLTTDTIFQWYCHNFDALERVFSKRKFMMHVYTNWEQYKEFLKSEEALSFMKYHQTEIENIISTQTSKRSRGWTETDAGNIFSGILDNFFRCLKETVKIPTVVEIEVKEKDPCSQMFLEFPQPEDTITFQIPSNDPLSDIDVEAVFDPLSIERFAYEPLTLPSLHIEDPFLTDEYRL